MEIVDAYLPQKETTPDGVKWLRFQAEPIVPIFKQYKGMPNCLKSDGVFYRKTSFNSDSYVIIYRECNESDVAFAV